LDTVHFDESIKQNLIADIRNYLDPRTQRLYQSRSMPYRRGYLLHGPPGTGKSSLSSAIAGEFGLDLYELKVPSMGSDADLEQAFQEIPPRCIVLLEDIDCVWARDQPMERLHHDTESHSSSSSSSVVPNVTLSGLLNVLDGVGSQEGRVVIMTTNKIEKLDSALVRPGRVDLKVHLGHISAKSAEDMFMRMFAPELLSWARMTTAEHALEEGPLEQYVSSEQVKMLAAKFASFIPEKTFTPSQLQGFFQVHLNSAVDAAAGIEAWVKREQGSCFGSGGYEISY
jgi:chaperone BCS1